MNDKSWTEYPPATVECSVTTHPSDAHDYVLNGPFGYRDVPPGPIAEFVASVVEGMGDRGIAVMRAIAADEQWGPLHLTRLVASAEVAARAVGGGLLAGTNHDAAMTLLVTESVSGSDLADMVAALRSEGLQAATDVARAMTPERRYRVLDVLAQYIGRFFTAALSGPETFI